MSLIEQLFSVTMYDVLLPLPGELAALGYSNHEELIKEMVSQRLAQNYQLVLFDDKATKPIERTAVAANAKPLYSLIVGRRIHHVRRRRTQRYGAGRGGAWLADKRVARGSALVMWQLLYGENKITVKQYIRQPGEESAASYRYMLYSSLEQRARVRCRSMTRWQSVCVAASPVCVPNSPCTKSSSTPRTTSIGGTTWIRSYARPRMVTRTSTTSSTSVCFSY